MVRLNPVITVPARRVFQDGEYGCVNLAKVVGGVYMTFSVNGHSDRGRILNVYDLDELIFTLTQAREFLKDG